MAMTGTLLVMLASLQWGLAGGFGSLLLQRDWTPEAVSFWRALVGVGVMLVWLALSWWRRGRPTVNRRMVMWAMLAGCGIAANFTFYFISISESSVAVAATLMYSAPIFVFVVSFLTGAERPSLVQWLAMAVVMGGIVLLTGIYRADAGVVTPFGIAAGLLAGVGYAFFIFGFRFAALHGSATAALPMALATAALLILPLADLSTLASVPASADVSLFLLVGVLGGALSFFCYVVGVRYTLPTMASIVAMVEPVTATLFGLFVLDESLTLPQVGGMLLILGAVTGISLLKHRAATASE